VIPWRRLDWGRIFLVWCGLSGVNTIAWYFLRSVVNRVAAFLLLALLLAAAVTAGVLHVRGRRL